MDMTQDRLVAAGIGPTQAALFASPLAAACALYGINTPARMAAFVGQCAHESQLFVHLEESLFYRLPEHIRATFHNEVPDLATAATLVCDPQKLANRVYCNRNGNGDELSGDGWNFRGRGLLQVTGRTNYRAAALLTGRPYEQQPFRLGTPLDACLAAAAWWKENGCNELADVGNLDAITHRINPAMLAANERLALIQHASTAFA